MSFEEQADHESNKQVFLPSPGGSLPLKKRFSHRNNNHTHDEEVAALALIASAATISPPAKPSTLVSSNDPTPSISSCLSNNYPLHHQLHLHCNSHDTSAAVDATILSSPHCHYTNRIHLTQQQQQQHQQLSQYQQQYITSPHPSPNTATPPTTPTLSSPLPNGCRALCRIGSKSQSYCRRYPCYNQSSYCKLHYQHYLISSISPPPVATAVLPLNKSSSSCSHSDHSTSSSSAASSSSSVADRAAAAVPIFFQATSPTNTNKQHQNLNHATTVPITPLSSLSSPQQQQHHHTTTTTNNNNNNSTPKRSRSHHIYTDKKYTAQPNQIQCDATTTRGRPCTYVAVNDTPYCHLHKDFACKVLSSSASSTTTLLGTCGKRKKKVNGKKNRNTCGSSGLGLYSPCSNKKKSKGSNTTAGVTLGEPPPSLSLSPPYLPFPQPQRQHKQQQQQHADHVISAKMSSVPASLIAPLLPTKLSNLSKTLCATGTKSGECGQTNKSTHKEEEKENDTELQSPPRTATAIAAAQNVHKKAGVIHSPHGDDKSYDAMSKKGCNKAQITSCYLNKLGMDEKKVGEFKVRIIANNSVISSSSSSSSSAAVASDREENDDVFSNESRTNGQDTKVKKDAITSFKTTDESTFIQHDGHTMLATSSNLSKRSDNQKDEEENKKVLPKDNNDDDDADGMEHIDLKFKHFTTKDDSINTNASLNKTSNDCGSSTSQSVMVVDGEQNKHSISVLKDKEKKSEEVKTQLQEQRNDTSLDHSLHESIDKTSIVKSGDETNKKEGKEASPYLPSPSSLLAKPLVVALSLKGKTKIHLTISKKEFGNSDLKGKKKEEEEATREDVPNSNHLHQQPNVIVGQEECQDDNVEEKKVLPTPSDDDKEKTTSTKKETVRVIESDPSIDTAKEEDVKKRKNQPLQEETKDEGDTSLTKKKRKVDEDLLETKRSLGEQEKKKRKCSGVIAEQDNCNGEMLSKDGNANGSNVDSHSKKVEQVTKREEKDEGIPQAERPKETITATKLERSGAESKESGISAAVKVGQIIKEHEEEKNILASSAITDNEVPFCNVSSGPATATTLDTSIPTQQENNPKYINSLKKPSKQTQQEQENQNPKIKNGKTRPSSNHRPPIKQVKNKDKPFDLRLFGTAAFERSRRTIHKPDRYDDKSMMERRHYHHHAQHAHCHHRSHSHGNEGGGHEMESPSHSKRPHYTSQGYKASGAGKRRRVGHHPGGQGNSRVCGSVHGRQQHSVTRSPLLAAATSPKKQQQSRPVSLPSIYSGYQLRQRRGEGPGGGTNGVKSNGVVT